MSHSSAVMDNIDAHRPNTRTTPRAVLWALGAAGVLLLATFAVRTAASWKNYADLDHNSVGTAVTLAIDARNGTLYRPIVSPLGYGGTRYAPLSPLLQAMLMKLGMSPVLSGYAIGLAAAALVLSGLFALMRRLGVPAGTAAAMTLLVLAASCFRTTVLEIKPDLLPLGFNLWGLAAVVAASEANQPARRRVLTFAAAICFALAPLAKFSSIFGIAAATLWLLFKHKPRIAMELCAVWLVAVAAMIGITQWASDGRAIAIFRLCGNAGGGLKWAMAMPAHFYDEAFHYDRPFLGYLLIACGLIVLTKNWTSLPTILLAVTALGTAAILASPGTRFNHFVDLDAAAVLVLAVLAFRTGRLGSIAILAAVGVAVLASVACWRQAAEIRRYAARHQMEAAWADTAQSTVDGPVLSEDPLLPILHGERPSMLDPFMFRVLRFKDPSLTERMWDELAEHRYKAVILHDKPTSDLYTDPADGNLGPGFVQQVEKYYDLVGVHGKFHVFLPKAH